MGVPSPSPIRFRRRLSSGILIPPYAREIGFVFQNYALWPHMTVFKNVAFGLKLRKLPTDEVRRKVLNALELVGLQGKEERYPSQLSGGPTATRSIGAKFSAGAATHLARRAAEQS